MSDQVLRLFPAWKQAVDDFLAEFRYGDIVPHEWLAAHFGLPEKNEKMTAASFQARQFEWLASIEGFKTTLLNEHQVLLQSVRGEGYRWLHPGEQSGYAAKELETDVKRTFRRAAQQLKQVRLHELTSDQRRENADTIGKLAALKGMTRKALAGPRRA